MATSDWTTLNDSLSQAVLDRGVTAGIPGPEGAGDFVFGFNSSGSTIVKGAAGLFVNHTGVAPTDPNKGGSVRGYVQRGVSAGRLGFAPMLFAGLQGPSVNDEGYLLGLADGDPHHVVLRKGRISDSVPDVAPGSQDINGVGGILRRSSDSFQPGTWLHLRLDMIANTNGDVILQVFRNKASFGAAEIWEPIQGMDQFIDDKLGVNSGSKPFTFGRMGFAFFSRDVNRRGYFDNLAIHRQV